MAVTPLAKQYLRNWVEGKKNNNKKTTVHTHTTAATQAGQKGAESPSYSQRKRNGSYKDKKSKENQLGMREIKKRLI